MLSISQLGADLPPYDPAKPIPQLLPLPKTRPIELRDAVIFGIIAGFATSLGTFVFDMIARRRR